MSEDRDLRGLILRRRAELGLSYRALAARSNGKVSYATLNNIVVGRHRGTFDGETLLGIAMALDVAPSAVRNLVGASPTPSPAAQLAQRIAKLPPGPRQTVIRVLELAEKARAHGTKDRGPRS